jgi:hypothetical protein
MHNSRRNLMCDEVTPTWAKTALRHPKSLNILLGVPRGQQISDDVLKRAAGLPGVLGKRARFALTLRRMSKAGRQCMCETRKKDEEGHGIRCLRRAAWICQCGTLYCRQHFRKAMKAGMTCRVDPIPTKKQEVKG